MVCGIHNDEIFLSKLTIPAEARGWQRFYAGFRTIGHWVSSMKKTDRMDDVVNGVAVAVTKDCIKKFDEYHNYPHNYNREEIYVKPTDLGPFYKSPVKAYAYTVVMSDPDDYYGMHTYGEGYD